MSAVTRYLVAQDGLSEFVGRAISWLTLAMIAVLMIEIVFRYFLDSPTIWAHETSTMLYGGFCILAGCYSTIHGPVLLVPISAFVGSGLREASCSSFTATQTVDKVSLSSV